MGKAERLFALTVVGHHHAAIGLRADGVGGDALHILQGGVDDMTLVGVHGLQRHAAAVLGHLGSHLTGQTLQTLLPLGAVVLRVHLDADALVTAGVDGVVGQLLDGVQRFAAAANELTQLVALKNDLITALLHLVDLDLGHAVHMLQQTGDKSHDALGVLVLAQGQVNGRDILLFSNPNTKKGRNHITIKASLDKGLTWLPENQVMLDEDEGWGYTCLTMIDRETVGILYESSVAHMTFQAIKSGVTILHFVKSAKFKHFAERVVKPLDKNRVL